ncbi:PREDICTED: dnaJ homolog subfamily C member 30 [Wasmannia auropunctata]|uniref:dnaJ homolog subfamily C member 30 n=1 Tax=Wasmannia auropunctata TaxID=64793 RepID=UPI0005EF7063|nr:PREDICTED: dnaJ homolog subfamily C member 30 [Wasmannia auropunctata]XP_011702359.1 PREDICTED: dnaJ homolog subfamily C member 30 [Wasmannia auropunctata]XP_011702360.1 PREDICTED: dnaJ homolog subfamily C member 30 [Wasmannia auropunctata]
MHAALVQSSLKFNMLHAATVTKSQLTRLYSTKRGGSSKPNHYDTLRISPRATQNEVKSAYYKLTLQFHPDKNDSEYAKQKFQDISEAYEVLGNHEQRKIYDRGVLLRQQPVSTAATAAEEPTSRYRDNVYSGSSKIYNFDAWTQAHYGQQMDAERKRRRAYEDFKRMKEEKSQQKDNPQYMEFAVLLFTITMIATLFREKTDVPVSERRKMESKDNQN